MDENLPYIYAFYVSYCVFPTLSEEEKYKLISTLSRLPLVFKLLEGEELLKVKKEFENDVNMVENNGEIIQYLKYQTEELCEIAVQQSGWALYYVKIPQTERMCELAVQQNGWALKYVKIPQTERMCELAVQQDGYALEFVKIPQTERMCELAVQRNGCALEFVKIPQTERMCELAVQENSWALPYVKIPQTERMCELARKWKDDSSD